MKTYCLQSITLLAVLTLHSINAVHAAPLTPVQAVPAEVKKEPLVHLSKVQSGSFSDALGALADQGHIAIVAEGVPLVARLAKKDIPDLTADIPLLQAVSEIGDAFDYDVQKQDKVFILAKRYTNPKDLPCVTLEECCLSISDALTLLNRFNPQFDERSEDYSQRSAVVAFFASLSSAQLQAAQAKALYYGELTPEQQEIVRNIILAGFVQFPANKVQETVDVLDYAPNSMLTGKDGDAIGGLLIQSPMPSNKALLYFHSLSSTGRVIRSSEPQSSLLLPKMASVTAPAAKVTTLAEVVGLLAYKGPPLAVDVSLKDKPVSVAGLRYASTMNILTALKVLYGIRIGASDLGAPKLSRPILTTDDSLQDLPSNLWTTLPLPMRRALHQEEAFPVDNIPADSKTTSAAIEQKIQLQEAINTLWVEANHQILLSIQPQLHSQGLGAHIPVKTLDKTAQNALGIALSLTALQELHDAFTGQIKQNVLDCLQNMNSILVYTIPSETSMIHGQATPSLYFQGTNPYTNQQIGLGGVRFMSGG